MFNVLLSVILSLSLVQAEASDPLEPNPNKPLGDVIPIEKAVSEFEKQYEKKVMMPEYFPFTPTVSGGNIDKSQDILRIDYLNEKSNKALTLEAHVNDLNLKSAKGEYFNLNNGIKAEIINDQSIDFLFINFKVNDLTYLIGINKNKYPDIEECIKELKKVANSIK